MAKINKHFIKWMDDEGISRRELSEKLNRIMRTISKYRAGEIIPRPDIISKIHKLSKGKVPYESWF